MNLETAVEFDKQLNSVVITRNLQSPKEVAKAVRSQFHTESPILEGADTRRSSDVTMNPDVDLDLQVRVEQSVVVEYQSWHHGGDQHQKPGLTWDS